MEYGHVFASLFLYVIAGLTILGDKRKLVEYHPIRSLLLGIGFLILTLVCDITEAVPPGYLCAVLWPICALYILERFAENPYVIHVENLRQRIEDDLQANNEDIRSGRRGLPKVHVNTLETRLKVLEEISQVYNLLKD